MIFSKLLLINTLQRLEAQTLGHYCRNISNDITIGQQRSGALVGVFFKLQTTVLE